MPLPVMHLRNKQTIVKTVNAPNCHCEERSDVAISGRHLQFVQGVDKMHGPIASVAALTAQPLAALPPYGCGVPLAGSERLWQLQVSRHFRRAYRLSSLSLRGGRRPTWQSRSTRLHRGKATGEIATAFPRLPRRFAPCNDTSGGCSGNNGASYQIGAIDCRFAGVAVPAPTLICETARSEISIHEQNKL